MRSAAALLAALAASAALAACGGGAEPGAAREATLVLDFTPNAAHAGIYDAPKLLAAGRTEFAILDIHDLAIARRRGLPLVGVAPIVDRPLASVIAADRHAVRTPADLAGKTVGVTGLPSDNAVLDAILRAGGVAPADVRRETIGFGAIPALASGRVDAATAFWNDEGVTLERRGVPIRVLRVDDYGSPSYPELVLATTERLRRERPGLVRAVVRATRRGYALAAAHPGRALDDLLAANPDLDRAETAAQLATLNRAPHGFRAAPHLDHLGATLVPVADDHLALDPGLVEERQRPLHRLGGRGVTEAVGDVEPPVPVGLRVGLGVDLGEDHRGVDVLRLVGDPQVDDHVRPVVGQGVEDRLEIAGEHEPQPR
jgi:putative hydroxymethylpyrimidine transport system substrate-binding protein